MDRKLKALFDYQKFSENKKLERLILEAESRYAKELSDDDISIVSAAGEPLYKIKKAEDNDYVSHN